MEKTKKETQGNNKKIVGVLIAVLTVGYMLPFSIAYIEEKKNTSAIFALNFFLGWTLVGWVVSLVWALANEE